MATMQQILFAQHFPFSETAKRIVNEQSVSLEQLPETVIERASLAVEHAAAGKKYALALHSTELLLQEILAFPVAKIFVSFAKDRLLYEKFAALFADAALHYLNTGKGQKEEAVALATELRLRFDFTGEKDFLVSVPLLEFLQVCFSDMLLKLVNQRVSKGRVFLDLNGFPRLLRAVVFERILGSLPVPVDGLPKNLVKMGQRFQRDFKAKQARHFQLAFKGKVNADAFPPCIASMYSQLLEGKNLPHMARFILASFLNRVGMPKQQVLELFRKAPNFKEKITLYQLDRIAKQNYTPASCNKIRSYGHCPNADCNVRNPLSFYRRRLQNAK